MLQGQEKFQFSSIFRLNNKIATMMALLLSGLASGIFPSIMQRMYMSSGPIQAKKLSSIQLFLVLL